MFTKWQEVEDWIRDNKLSWWKFQLEKSGNQVNADGQVEQKRSNTVIILSDAYDPADMDEKIRLTKKRLECETNHIVYGWGKRGKENTGMMYCEVRLEREWQQPGTLPVASVPQSPQVDEAALVERIRKEIKTEMELQRYEAERKEFEEAKAAFEAEKASAIGLAVKYFSPVVAALSQKRVAGVDAASPVQAAPVQPIEAEIVDELFTEEESDKLFELMARFKQAEPDYLSLIESVVAMAESKDGMYEMAKNFLVKK